MNVKKYFIIQFLIVYTCFPAFLLSQTIQTGSWSSSADDVGFYISQQSQLDTLRVKITFTSGNCSGSITKYSYGVAIADRSFSRDLGSSYDGSTGSITGNFSEDGTSCSGSYSYTTDNCGTVSSAWTATVSDTDTTEADLVYIPDLNFKNALIEGGVDTNKDGGISYMEAAQLSSMDVAAREISDLTGLEAFINLDSLSCQNNLLTDLDVSGNPALTFLWCSENQLSELDVSGNKALIVLWCRSNQFTKLNISGNPALKKLSCRSNQLSILDISWNPALEQLSCRNNLITSLDISGNSALQVLWCSGNPLGSLDLSNNAALYDLWCDDNQLASLDVSSNSSLVYLWCEENALSNLDVSGNRLLESLWCGENQLTSLNISNNLALEELSCGRNLLSNLDVSKNIYLEYLWFNINQISNLDVSANTSLVDLWCIGNDLTTIDLSNNPNLESLFCSYNQLNKLDVSRNPALVELWCGGNMLSSLNISNNSALGSRDSDYDELDLSNMPSLYEVCVWTMPFPSTEVKVDISDSPNAYFTDECSIGIEDSDLSGLSVYPNPTSSLLTIESETPDRYYIQISTLNGQLVFNTIMDGSKCQINLSGFQKGVYFITLASEGSVTTKKIIKLE